MKEITLFSVLTIVFVLVASHFFNQYIPEHQYPTLFKFLKNI
ncbi:hypothetical protein [Bacillus sp. E(2018)]|nr:hypothetical protein [Bacillus sp. E(2018)]